jgi:hypothetical protein
MKLRDLPLLLLLAFIATALAPAQGYHRVSQLLVRSSGVQANVAPYASILVCTAGTNCASQPNIYADAGLTQQLSQPVIADKNGNYSYYVGVGCVDEQYTIIGASPWRVQNVCFTAAQPGSYSLTVAALTYATQVVTTTSIVVPLNPTGSPMIPVCTPSGYSIPTNIFVGCDVSSTGYLNFRITNSAGTSAGNWAGATFTMLYKFL